MAPEFARVNSSEEFCLYHIRPFNAVRISDFKILPLLSPLSTLQVVRNLYFSPHIMFINILSNYVLFQYFLNAFFFTKNNTTYIRITEDIFYCYTLFFFCDILYSIPLLYISSAGFFFLFTFSFWKQESLKILRQNVKLVLLQPKI